jgi:hypothetical protein
VEPEEGGGAAGSAREERTVGPEEGGGAEGSALGAWIDLFAGLDLKAVRSGAIVVEVDVGARVVGKGDAVPLSAHEARAYAGDQGRRTQGAGRVHSEGRRAGAAR